MRDYPNTMNEYLEKIFEADAVILGSPTYFANVSTEMKALLDRQEWLRWLTVEHSKARSGLRLLPFVEEEPPRSLTASTTCSLCVHDRAGLHLLEPGHGTRQGRRTQG